MPRQPRIPGTTTSRRTLYLLPSIPDHLDAETKNALAIRNAASTEGRCPDCGAEPEIHPDTELPGLWHAVFRHETYCRAYTDGDAA